MSVKSAENKSVARNPIRARVSCPDCGWIDFNKDPDAQMPGGFNCGRCGAHYAEEDFWKDHEQKLQALWTKRAQADLEYENE